MVRVAADWLHLTLRIPLYTDMHWNLRGGCGQSMWLNRECIIMVKSCNEYNYRVAMNIIIVSLAPYIHRHNNCQQTLAWNHWPLKTTMHDSCTKGITW